MTITTFIILTNSERVEWVRWGKMAAGIKEGMGMQLGGKRRPCNRLLIYPKHDI